MGPARGRNIHSAGTCTSCVSEVVMRCIVRVGPRAMSHAKEGLVRRLRVGALCKSLGTPYQWRS